MGKQQGECEYESRRKTRILENKVRMASLGLDRHADALRSLISSKSPVRKSTVRKAEVKVLGAPRRSNRLKGKPAYIERPLSDSSRKASIGKTVPAWRKLGWESRGGGARGSVYDQVLGICCHFCRQKKLCAEENCKRCNTGDMNEPCTGKTECTACHSSNGILCRACLKIRYGEDLEVVRKMKDWMCPHCIEEKGIRPYWICNSSLCLRRKKMSPTGIAIYHAREEGFESVAHLLMDQLKKVGGAFHQLTS